MVWYLQQLLLLTCNVLPRTLIAAKESPGGREAHEAIHGRAAEPATVTLNSGGFSTVKSAPTTVPSGFISSNQNDEMYVFFSDELHAQLQATVNTECNLFKSQHCQDSILLVLESSGLSPHQLAPRVAQAGIVNGLLNYISIGIYTYRHEHDIPKAIHFSPADLKQMSAVATNTAVVVVTSSGAAGTTVSVPARPTKATGTIPTVSISPPSSGSTSQDLHIRLPPDLANMAQEIMSRGASCSSSSLKRQSGSALDCITFAATSALYNSFPGYSLSDLLSFDGSVTFPKFLDPSEQSELQSFQDDAQKVAQSLGITPAEATKAGTLIWDLAYIEYGLGQDLSTDNVIPGYLFKNSTNNGCPPEAPKRTSLKPFICQFSNCQGDPDSRLCTSPKWKDCECLNLADPEHFDYIDQTMYDLQPAALKVWETLGLFKDPPPPPPGPNPKCYQTPGSGAYVTLESLSSAVATFCAAAAGDVGQSAYSTALSYYAGSLDEVRLTLNGIASHNIDTDKCIESMNIIVNGCDGDPSNPMNWRFGGQFIDGPWNYTITPQRTNRVVPFTIAPRQACKGSYNVLYSSYTITGSGFSSWDFGSTTLAPAISKCVGKGGLTSFDFTYFDAPDSAGLEWQATFNTPIKTQPRCFDNNKVTQNAGGPGPGGGGCHGSG